MSRYDRAAMAERWTAQEARKDARAGDHAYATAERTRFQSGAQTVDTLPRTINIEYRDGGDYNVDGSITLPWPPTGNTAVRHANGAHYLQPAVIAYRDSVAALCARFEPVRGQYRLHVHLSPPDARARDMDNALKSLNDALVKAGYIESDSMTYMRELLVTTDDERRGNAIVRAVAI